MYGKYWKLCSCDVFQPAKHKIFNSYYLQRFYKVSQTMNRQASCLSQITSKQVLARVYINDVKNCTELVMVSYSDDCTAYVVGDSLEALIVSVNWLSVNKLSLKGGKSLFTFFSSKFQLATLKSSQEHSQLLPLIKNFFGVIIDNKGEVCTKQRHSMSMIKKKYLIYFTKNCSANIVLKPCI